MNLDEADATRERDAWRNVIACLCGDGGHYHQEHGTEATAKHCLERFHGLLAERDALQARVAALENYIGVCHECGKPLAILEAICWPCQGAAEAAEGAGP